MKKRALFARIAMTLSILFVCSACAAKGSGVSDAAPAAEAPYAANMAQAASAESAMEAPMGLFSVAESAPASAQAPAMPGSGDKPGDADVRKIIYDGDMSLSCDDPAAALQGLVDKAASLGGYLAGSDTYNSDDGATHCSATLKVPYQNLEALVTAAKATGKVESYSLASDDISGEYYDVQARLAAAKAEEAQLTALLEKCETVEEVLKVRESLASVRADIESYQGRISLWDQLVAYATLRLNIRQTPKTAVGETSTLIEIWKASDVFQKMSDGFVNSCRFMVNALGAIGIFLAIAVIPAGILFLCIGLPIILRKKKKKRLAAEKAAAAGAEAEEAPEGGGRA